MADEKPENEDVDLFDPSVKKKKKKKVPKFDEEEPAAAPVAEAPAEEAPAPSEPIADDDFSGMKKKKKKKPTAAELAVLDDAELNETNQDAGEQAAPAELDDAVVPEKKKKKKKVPDFDSFEGGVPEGGEASVAPADGDEPPAEDNLDNLEDFSKEKKKKKKKPVKFDEFENEGDNEPVIGADEIEMIAPEPNEDNFDPNRDYLYSELLARVFRTLRQNNPELAGEKKRYTIAPPQVHREGNKKTIFANIADICRRMHRQPEHVVQFLFAELGTSGSTDGSQRLVIKGRFQQKQIENVLRRYILEYVTCKTCKSPDTILTKDNRLFFLKCESCGSSRSVSAIKTGFKAQTEKRSVARRAATT